LDETIRLDAGRAGGAAPCFWGVQVQATVTELGGASYTATEIVWVEPLTGWTFTFGAG
jgi:hypothetical protein